MRRRVIPDLRVLRRAWKKPTSYVRMTDAQRANYIVWHVAVSESNRRVRREQRPGGEARLAKAAEKRAYRNAKRRFGKRGELAE